MYSGQRRLGRQRLPPRLASGAAFPFTSGEYFYTEWPSDPVVFEYKLGHIAHTLRGVLQMPNTIQRLVSSTNTEQTYHTNLPLLMSREAEQTVQLKSGTGIAVNSVGSEAASSTTTHTDLRISS